GSAEAGAAPADSPDSVESRLADFSLPSVAGFSSVGIATKAAASFLRLAERSVDSPLSGFTSEEFSPSNSAPRTCSEELPELSIPRSVGVWADSFLRGARWYGRRRLRSRDGVVSSEDWFSVFSFI